MKIVAKHFIIIFSSEFVIVGKMGNLLRRKTKEKIVSIKHHHHIICHATHKAKEKCSRIILESKEKKFSYCFYLMFSSYILREKKENMLKKSKCGCFVLCLENIIFLWDVYWNFSKIYNIMFIIFMFESFCLFFQFKILLPKHHALLKVLVFPLLA